METTPSALHDYLLLLLSDSNLPTGGFVASSGLESSISHGFFSPINPPQLLSFLRLSLTSYARLALPFFKEVWSVIDGVKGKGGEEEEAVERVGKLDDLYDSMTLNHVARRASQAQGAALLTLYTKAFAATASDGDTVALARKRVVSGLKLRSRQGSVAMHLPTAFAVLAAALGLPFDRSAHLHLFLHARSILSSAVRLNSIGPYTSQSLLFHDVRPLIDDVLCELAHVRLSREDMKACGLRVDEREEGDGDEGGPATIWPLGEILGARHDNTHVRLFNS